MSSGNEMSVLSPLSETIDAIPNGLQELLQRQVHTLQQQITAKTTAYEFLENMADMLQKRLETKDARIANLTEGLKKLQTQKKENEVRLTQTIQEMEMKMKHYQESVVSSSQPKPGRSNSGNSGQSQLANEKDQNNQEEKQRQMQADVYQTKEKLQNVENIVEKFVTDLKQWMTGMEQNNETSLHQSFVQLNEATKEMKQEMQIRIEYLQKAADIVKTKYNQDENKKIEIWNERWKDLLHVKTVWNEIHGQCSQLVHLSAGAKDMRDLTVSIQECVKRNGSQPTLKEWLKHQMSQPHAIAHYIPQVRHIILTLLCRTFVTDLTLETTLMEIQVKADNFIRAIEANKEQTDQISEEIICWCGKLMEEQKYACIRISSEILPQSIHSVFQSANDSVRATSREITLLVADIAKSSKINTEKAKVSPKMAWLGLLVFLVVMFCLSFCVKMFSQITQNSMYW